MRRRALLAVNLTPLIDVVFLLLIYFLLVADFRRDERTIPLQTPQTAESAPEEDPFRLPRRPVRITLRSIDAATCDISSDAPAIGEPLDFRALRRAAAAARGDVFDTDQEFIIAATSGSLWDHSVRAVDALRRAGYSEIIFSTPQETSP